MQDQGSPEREAGTGAVKPEPVEQMEETSTEADETFPPEGQTVPKQDQQVKREQQDQSAVSEQMITVEQKQEKAGKNHEANTDIIKLLPEEMLTTVPEHLKENCMVCFDGEDEEDNLIIFCDGCNVAVHQKCYGVHEIPKGDWYCTLCEHRNNMKAEGTEEDEVECPFCPMKDGIQCCAHATNLTSLLSQQPSFGCSLMVSHISLQVRSKGIAKDGLTLFAANGLVTFANKQTVRAPNISNCYLVRNRMGL